MVSTDSEIKKEKLSKKKWSKIKIQLKTFLENSANEVEETKEASILIKKYLSGEELSETEVESIKEQILDIFKGAGIIVPFALIPGASLLMPFLIKFANKNGINILPSSFNNTNKDMEKLNEIIEIENEIIKTIKEDNGCLTHFEYSNVTSKKGFDLVQTKIDVYTLNPKTKETFLLKTIINDYKYDGLNEALTYVKNHKTVYYSFTVTWTKKSDNQKHVSYFYCKDMFEVLEKFFHNKEQDEYVIFEIKLNPIS